MIIECKNCLRKFSVRDVDIPIKGRVVQCGNCSSQWLQIPIAHSIEHEDRGIIKKTYKKATSGKTKDFQKNQNLRQNAFEASDGKTYKFLGNQWAEVLSTGKYGRLAKKKISQELNKLAGRKIIQKKEIKKKSKDMTDQYHESNAGMGIFSFFIVLIMFVSSIILLLDTFKNQLIPFFPSLDNYLIYIFETLNNIYIIIKDLFDNYK